MKKRLRYTKSESSKSAKYVCESVTQGFTLVELLVVITIVLILTAVTVASYNYSVNADRIRAGARQFQSFLAGARDKAIYAKEIRGVRLLLDPSDSHTVNAIQYIGSPKRETGTLTFVGGTGLNATLQPATSQYWLNLYRSGYLRVGSQIQIPRDTGAWYTITGYDSGTGTISINRRNRELAATTGQIGFVLLLAPGALGDSQPVELPRGVVIDLDGSSIPSNWRPTPFTGSYSMQMDILFTPRGTVVGDALGLGLVHLHFADAGDVANWHKIGGRDTSVSNSSNLILPFVPVNDPNAAKPVVKRDRIVATLATQTGSVSIHYVNTPNTAPPNPSNPAIAYQYLASDPFVFAETGQVANK